MSVIQISLIIGQSFTLHRDCHNTQTRRFKSQNQLKILAPDDALAKQTLCRFSNRFTVNQWLRIQAILLETRVCCVSKTWKIAMCPAETSESNPKTSHLICTVPCSIFYWPTGWRVLPTNYVSSVSVKTDRVGDPHVGRPWHTMSTIGRGHNRYCRQRCRHAVAPPSGHCVEHCQPQ